MKIVVCIVIALIIFTTGSFAQEQTLLGSGQITHGGFGGPVVKYVQIKGEPGVLVGGRGGWIINHIFVLGGGGYGLANDILAYTPPVPAVLGVDPYSRYINFGYGGLEMEYIIQSDRILHFTVYTLIGAGGISYRDEYWNGLNSIDDGNYDSPSDAFFILEPAVNIEINVISFMRVCGGISYRFISGVNLDNLRNKDFAGPSGVLTLKFGKF